MSISCVIRIACTQNVTSIDVFKRLVNEKCANVSGSDVAFEAIERGIHELTTCISGLIDVEQIQNEIEYAETKGELDTLFNRYCQKRNVAIRCTETFTNLLEPCLQVNEIGSKRTFVKILKKIMDFVCFKDGDQLALFYMEKGFECISKKRSNLNKCMNSLFTDDYMSSNLTTLPELVIGEQQCE